MKQKRACGRTEQKVLLAVNKSAKNNLAYGIRRLGAVQARQVPVGRFNIASKPSVGCRGNVPSTHQVTVCLSPAFHTELAVGLVMGGDIASRGRKASGFPRTVMARVSRRNTTCMTAESRDMRDEA